MEKNNVGFSVTMTSVTFTMLIASLILIITIGVANASESTANPFHPPLNPDDYPLPASITAIGSSTSFTSSSGSSDASSAQKIEVITETRESVLNNQSPTHMINFKNEGNLKAICLSGSGFELYSKKSDSFPEKSAFRSDYGSSSMVTNTTPVTLDISPGTWYFTVFPIGEDCTYDITATQKGSASSTGSGSGSSFSSSMGATSISLG